MQNAKTSAQRGGADLYTRVTELIVAELEKGRIPWRKRWGILENGQVEVARNYVSKRNYTGINSVLLGCANYERPYYLTFKQATELGGNIRKGAKGNLVVFWNVLEKEKEVTNRKGETKTKKVGVPLLKHYFVFNVADVEGITIELPKLLPPDAITEAHRIEACDAVCASYANAPDIVHRDPARAFYSPLFDYVNMPRPSAFDCPEAYYSVLFHELVHSTGHRDRLNREELVNSDGFGGERYAKEELTAEIGACYLAGSCGLDLTDHRLLTNAAAYLNNWLAALKGDKTLIFRASGQAQKAVDYVLNGVAEEVEPETVAA
ncbi:ArdC family protein [Spirosoma sp. 209]|uniref:ArdC family protein n=1 Tax=Spirosoma sp. 209 TaxID=1955701 RepID=UPI00098D21C2|nr:zincin-like metallopeptidase domain-containing protein [Spirosoma sp. 209]